jgi:hypothetical protein
MSSDFKPFQILSLDVEETFKVVQLFFLNFSGSRLKYLTGFKKVKLDT